MQLLAGAPEDVLRFYVCAHDNVSVCFHRLDFQPGRTSEKFSQDWSHGGERLRQFGVQGYITHPKEFNFLHNGIRIFYVSLYSIQRFLSQNFCHRSVPEELHIDTLCQELLMGIWAVQHVKRQIQYLVDYCYWAVAYYGPGQCDDP